MEGNWLREPITCKDGFKMSVQASEMHYCSPRENNAEYYTTVEVGFPSEQEETLMPYAEEPVSPTETVYGWVPIQVVSAIIEKHGGIISGECPPLTISVFNAVDLVLKKVEEALP